MTCTLKSNFYYVNGSHITLNTHGVAGKYQSYFKCGTLINVVNLNLVEILQMKGNFQEKMIIMMPMVVLKLSQDAIL